MGAWGTGSLDNDSGQDWLADFSEFGVSAAEEMLGACAEGIADGYIDADVASGIIALAEVVATAKGAGDENLSDQLDGPADSHKDALLDIDNLEGRVSEALEAVSADAETSELYELWAESDELDAWLEQIVALRARLDAA